MARILMVERVLATDAALQLINKLKAQYGPLMFHQSGGCCDGSAPMCYVKGEFHVGGNDKYLGEVGGCPVHIELVRVGYWKHAQLIIDVVPGRGHGFTPEAPAGLPPLTPSPRFTDEELERRATRGTAP